MTTELTFLLVLILANGVFAGAEIAVLALRKSRLETLVDAGSKRAKAVQALRNRPETFLATVQIGITVVSATAAAFGGASIAARLTPLLAGVSWIGAARAQEVSLAAVVAGVSFLSLVLGELVPKSLALKVGESYALLMGPPLLFLSSVARPLVWVLTTCSNLILRPFGDRTNFTEARLSPEELQQMLEEASKTGVLDSRAGEIATRAIDFEKLRALDVMVPRNRIVAIPRGASRDELRRVFLEARHSRIPVFEGNLDNVVGYIAADDMLTQLLEKGELALEPLLRPVLVVPEVKAAPDVLQRLQKDRSHLAMVVDEFGGVSGLVTLEDLVEELVGEVLSEQDRVDERARREPDGSFVIKGFTPIRNANRDLGLDLPEGSYTTIAGLCLEVAGRMVHPGEKLTLEDGTVLEIVEGTSTLVRSVRIRPAKPAIA